jgi:hypothetical protein
MLVVCAHAVEEVSAAGTAVAIQVSRLLIPNTDLTPAEEVHVW